MTDPQAPPVPADIDLSKLDGFMLDTARLLGSELVALATGDEFKAAVVLWCRAWKQRPAASLPNDEKVLAAFAMVPPAKWRKIRDMALRGFVECSDGRLYHPVLAADALRAAEAMRKRHERTKAATEARQKERDAQRSAQRDDERDVERNDVPKTGHRQDIDSKKEEQESALSAEFADWYSGYPRREGRGQALKAYRVARKRATAEQLIAGRNRYAEVCRGKDPQFIRLPATWLNGEGWLDEPSMPARPDRRKNIGFC